MAGRRDVTARNGALSGDGQQGDDQRGKASSGIDVPGRNEAAFNAVRVSGGTRAPVAALGLAILVGSVAAVAILGRDDAGAESAAAASSAAATAAPMRDVPATRVMPVPTPRAAAGPDRLPRYTAGLAIDARVDGRRIVIHGDVFTPNAVVVILSIADAEDDVFEVRSVEVARGSTAMRLGPSERFRIEIQIPDGVAAGWVHADAIDHDGQAIASVRERLAAPHVTDGWRVEDGT